MINYEHLWQATPSRLISHAMEHARKDTTFDKIMAFLILDVGVETIFKVFLDEYGLKEFRKAKQKEAQKGRHELSFHTIINTVKESAGEKLQNIRIDDVNHYHNKRSKIYHDGAYFPPPQEDLDGYLDIAKMLLKVLLNVDIDKSQEQELGQKQELVQNDYSQFSLAGIRRNIISLQSNSSLMVEHVYPQIATRKIEALLRYIRTDTGPDDESYPPHVKAEFRQQRIDAFNKITGWDFTYDEEDMDDYEFVEYIIDNPEQLHVWFALQEISSDDWHKDWAQYQRAVNFLEHEQDKNSKVEDARYEEIFKWTHRKAGAVIDWIGKHIPNITVVGPAMYLDFE